MLLWSTCICQLTATVGNMTITEMYWSYYYMTIACNAAYTRKTDLTPGKM